MHKKTESSGKNYNAKAPHPLRADSNRPPVRVEEPELMKRAIAVEAASRHAKEFVEPWVKTASEILVAGEGRKLAHSWKGRVKPVTDILSKVARKRHGAEIGTDDWAYDPHHITDGCGFRVVVLFQEDILLVIEEIIKMVQHRPPYTDNPIAGLKEAIIYTNLPIDDDEGLARRMKARLDAEGDGAGFDKSEIREPENRKGGYSSVHFVVWVNLGSRGGTLDKLPIEIQIRDVFEEAWSEIDHTLRYVNDRESRSAEVPIQNNWRKHLAALKTHADGCSQHAALIKETAIETLKRQAVTSQNPSNGRPSDPPQTLASLLARLVPESQDALETAFGTMAQAQDAADEDGKAALFEEAARMFQLVLESLSPDQLEYVHNQRSIEYHLTMERAFCLQAVPKTECKQEAAALYESAMSRWPEDAFAIYRLANCRRSLGELERAIELYRKGLRQLDADSALPKDSWLHSAMPRQLGFCLWRAYEAAPNDEQAKPLLAEAIETTGRAVDSAQRLKLNHNELGMGLNNLLYYRFLRAQTSRSTKDDAELKALASDLQARLPKDGVLTPYLSSLHTLMKVYDLLGDIEARKAVVSELARGLFEMARARARQPELPIVEVRKHLPPNLFRIHDDVNAILWAAGGACMPDQKP